MFYLAPWSFIRQCDPVDRVRMDKGKQPKPAVSNLGLCQALFCCRPAVNWFLIPVLLLKDVVSLHYASGYEGLNCMGMSRWHLKITINNAKKAILILMHYFSFNI